MSRFSTGATSKLGTQFSSLICVEDMSELAEPPRGPRGPRWATPYIQSQLVRGWLGNDEQLALSH